jgi:L,D-transpeptidase catalytic domain
MCRASSSVVAIIAFLATLSAAAAAEVRITVDKNIQRMTVTVDGIERYSWPVSTGLEDYATPTGAFTPSRLARQHYSREWDNAPMPHSIFFTDAGHAIHGSNIIGRLGQPASHGCVRLAPRNAELLFRLVLAEGLENTRIDITGTDPIGIALGGESEAPKRYSRLTSFDPLTTGIMAGGSGPRVRASENPSLSEKPSSPPQTQAPMAATGAP